MAGIFDYLAGNAEEKKGKIRQVAELISSERLEWRHGGYYSPDDVVGVLPKGSFSKGYIGACTQTQPSSLVVKGELIGDGKSWFAEGRFRRIISCIEKQPYRLYFRKSGNSPALIVLGEAEILVAPYIK